ncbi:hypothetical protein K0M31_007379, partial [Melipona bicolor]
AAKFLVGPNVTTRAPVDGSPIWRVPLNAPTTTTTTTATATATFAEREKSVRCMPSRRAAMRKNDRRALFEQVETGCPAASDSWQESGTREICVWLKPAPKYVKTRNALGERERERRKARGLCSK